MLKTSISVGEWLLNGEGSAIEGFERIREAGFDCIDFQPIHDPAGFYAVGEESAVNARLSSVRRASEESGVGICQTHALWFANDSSEERRKKNFAGYVKNVIQTALLGCKNLVIHPIMPNGWEKETSAAEKWEINLAFFRELLHYAHEEGVTLCLENLPFRGYSLNDMPDVKRFVDELDDENAAICLDTGHSNCVGRNPAEDARLCGSKLKALHVHDNSGRGDEHKFPYFGTVDWEDFTGALKEIGYDGALSMEVAFGEKLPSPSREFMQKSLGALARTLARKAQ